MSDTCNYTVEKHKRLGVANQISLNFLLKLILSYRQIEECIQEWLGFQRVEADLLNLFYDILSRSQVLQDSTGSNASLLVCACIFQNTFTLNLNGMQY